MRIQAYRLFAIVAWPAVVWCAIETAVRLATGAYAGMGMTALTGACAALTVVAVRARTQQLSATATVRSAD
jgi:hypothetical protein